MSSVPLQVQFDASSGRFGASRSQKGLEDDRLLTGKGRYSDDLEFPNQCWLVFVRSPYAHARVGAVDLSAVKSAAGVIAAWTMADLRADGVGHIPIPPLFKRADGSPMAAPPRTPLADGTVHFVGQTVVAIVAQTRAEAQDAAELAAIDYQDLPCVVDAKAAIEPGAPQVWPQAAGNVAAEASYGDAAAVKAAMQRAAHVTELELRNQRVIAMALEPRACIGVVENGRTTLYTQNQTPTGAVAARPRGGVHTTAGRGQGTAARLRRLAGALSRASRAHGRHADRRLPRRGRAGAQFPHRPPARDGRARDEARSRRTTAAQ